MPNSLTGRRVFIVLTLGALAGCGQKAPPAVVIDDPAGGAVVIANPPEAKPAPPAPAPEAGFRLPLDPPAAVREPVPARAAGQALSGTLQSVLGEQTHTTSRVLFTADGQWLLSAGVRPDITAWDLKTGAVAGRYPVFPAEDRRPVVRIWGSPDGRTLASTAPKGELWLWDLPTGTVRQKLKADQSFSNVSFTADGKTLFTLNNRRVHRWGANTGAELGSSAEVTRGFHREAMVAAPDGRRVALAGEGGDIAILDGKTLRLEAQFTAHAEWVHALAISPDGKTLASTGFRDKRIKLWNLDTATEIRSFDCGCSFLQTFTVAFSPSGKYLAAGGSSVAMHEVATGVHVATLHSDYRGVHDLAFSPDGTLLAGAVEGGERGIAVWELAPTVESRTVATPQKQEVIALGRGGTTAAVRTEAGLVLRDLATGKDVLLQAGNVRGGLFSPDGSLFATTRHLGDFVLPDKETVIIVDTATGEPKRKFEVNTSVLFLWSAAFSPDGKRLALAVESEVQLWDVTANPPRRITTFAGAQRGQVKRLAYSPDGKRLAVGVSSALTVIDAETGHSPWLVPAFEGEVTNIAFSPDGKRVAVGGWSETDHSARIFDTGDGSVIATLRHPKWVRTAQFADPQTVATIDEDGVVRLWDATEGKALGSRPGQKPEEGLLVAADGKAIAVLRKESARLYALDALRRDAFVGRADLFRQPPATKVPPVYLPVRAELKWHNNSPVFAAFSADSTRLVSVDSNNKVAVWDASTGQRLKGFTALVGDLRQVAVSPDGKRLAFSSFNSPTVSIWNVETGREERRLNTGHKGPILAGLAFSPEGKLLATGGDSRILKTDPHSILLWDAQTGEKLGSFDENITVYSLSFTHDGQLLVRERDDTLHLFDVAKRKQVWEGRPPEGTAVRAVSPDGVSVLVGPVGERLGGMAVWDRASGKLSPTFHVDNEDVKAAFGPGGLLVVSTGTVYLWDTKKGKLITQFHAPWITTISPDGKTLLITQNWLRGQGTLALVDVRELRDGMQEALQPVLAQGAKVTPDGDGLRIEMSLRGPEAIAALASLNKLTRPITLVIVKTSVLPDAAVQAIKQLKNLRALGLRAAVTHDALTVLAPMPELVELTLTSDDYARITETNAARLKALKHLRRLRLDTLHGDDTLAAFRDLTTLIDLDLADRVITDAGLSYLKGMTSLESLDLRATRITDAGLVHLEGLTKLRRLSVGRTKVPEKGIEALKKKLPDLQVSTE